MSCGYVKSINLFVGKDCTLHLINIRKTRYSILWTRIDKKTNSYLLTIGVLNKALRPFIKGTIDMWWIWNIETVLKAQNLDLKEKRFIIQEITNRNHLRISQSSCLLEIFLAEEISPLQRPRWGITNKRSSLETFIGKLYIRDTHLI